MKKPVNILIGVCVALGLGLIAYGITKELVPNRVVPTPPKDTGTVCIQVITPARDPATGTITEFPTPCDVPEGWEIIQNDIPELDLEEGV